MKQERICPKCNINIITRFEKHVSVCDGNGPRRRKKIKSKNFGLGYGWHKDKSWEEVVGKEKSDELKKNWKSKSENLIHTDETKENLSKLMKERYANGWEVKCGRAPKIDYESPIAGLIKLDGSWELKVAKYLDSINVKWKRNKERFKYNNIIKGGVSTYCPDFYVEDWNEYIEVKGYKTDLDEVKWSQFKYNLQIWDKNKLKELKIL